MLIRDALLPEFDRETAITRRLLERIPDGKLSFKPHPKSMDMASLATHICELIDWTPEPSARTPSIWPALTHRNAKSSPRAQSCWRSSTSPSPKRAPRWPRRRTPSSCSVVAQVGRESVLHDAEGAVLRTLCSITRCTTAASFRFTCASTTSPCRPCTDLGGRAKLLALASRRGPGMPRLAGRGPHLSKISLGARFGRCKRWG